MSGRTRILAVGVGGQGVITAARAIGDAAMDAGLGVAVGGLHGMSQRGGSVQSTVLIGPGESSFIADGEADLVLGLEPMEVLRARPKMSGRTRVLVNLGIVVPFTLGLAGQGYPEMEAILEGIRSVAGEVVILDGPALVGRAGDLRSLNVILLGALDGLGGLPLPEGALWGSLERRLAESRREAARRAFELGREAVASAPAG